MNMTRTVQVLYFGILLCAAGCGLLQGGGVGKCPADATCGWLNVGGEKFWVCTSQLLALQAKAARLESKP